MSENGHDLVADLHRGELERLWHEKAEEFALVEAMFREARTRCWDEQDWGKTSFEQIRCEGADHACQDMPSVTPRQAVHYSELPEATPDRPLAAEWNTYRQEVGRLLADGNEGKFVLVKDTAIVGLFDTWEAARAEGLKRFLRQSMLIQPIRAWEPLLRIRGYSLRWNTSISQSSRLG